MILQNHDDFDIIVKEIESIGIKPINVERNKLYSYDDYSLKKLFQRIAIAMHMLFLLVKHWKVDLFSMLKEIKI